MIMKRLVMMCCIVILFTPFSFISPHSTYAEVNTTYKKHELRAVWLASVLNIDWPSKTGLPIEKQKQEFIRLLDDVKNTGMNAVVVQIKPTADAFYPSNYGPWSEYITGTQGKGFWCKNKTKKNKAHIFLTESYLILQVQTIDG
ncbi:TPA: family 10 glycosylhydrolase [Bacillus mycoides]|nr:family 10 glycosylhydrolase [Bacillus mycoides]